MPRADRRADPEQVREMLRAGLTYAAIAERMGVSTTRVSQIARSWHAPYTDNYSKGAVCARCGVPVTNITRRRAKGSETEPHCKPCWNEIVRERNARRPFPPHGTHAAYRRGCRCDECRAFQAAKRRDYRRRTGR